ncbi:MAG: hypothetical protein ACXWC9_10375, partial [Pseudobdellovibrionaceae bacterium]
MNARQIQIKTVFHYTVGRVYLLEDLQGVVVRLKTISSRQVGVGKIFHLYREKGTDFLWMEGPFKGEGSSGFMYLGPKKTKSQFKKFLIGEFKSLAQDVVVRSTDLFMGPSQHSATTLSEFEQLQY